MNRFQYASTEYFQADRIAPFLESSADDSDSRICQRMQAFDKLSPCDQAAVRAHWDQIDAAQQLLRDETTSGAFLFQLMGIDV